MRILLAEDDKELSRVLTKIFKMNKFDVDNSYDGVEALEYLSVYKYDAVVLDVMMPKLDGIQVVKRIRAKKNNVPVLLLTAKSEVDDKVLGLESGADDYLTKPFVSKELIARVRALTRRSTNYVESYTLGNMNLDTENSELCVNGNKLHLTNKEFKILELLIRNKDRLTSTERIMETVWELDSNAEINVVWVFISSLRKKLELMDCNYTIKAVRGLGYKLEAVK